MDYSFTGAGTKPLSRDYKCPCGKTYLSYAALFTHIKQKHDGKVSYSIIQAPGQIQKPKVESKPRGRPPLASKVKATLAEKDGQASKETENTVKGPGEKDQNKVYYDSYIQIFSYLKHILGPEEIDLKIWEQVDSFKKIEDFIDGGSENKSFNFEGVTLGHGLSEFLKGVSLQA